MYKFLLFTIISTFSLPAFSCGKATFQPPEALKKSDIVFRGKVTNLQYLDDPAQEVPEPKIIVTFNVSKLWKGSSEKTLVIHTTHNKTTCNGYAFNAGEEYPVYAKFNNRKTFLAKFFGPKEPTLGIKIYGGTKPIAIAESDLNFLSQDLNTK